MAKAALAVVGHFAPAAAGDGHDEPACAFGPGGARPADAARDLPPADAPRAARPAGRRDRRNDRLSAQHAVDASRHSGARGPGARHARRALDRLSRRCRRHARACRLPGRRLLRADTRNFAISRTPCEAACCAPRQTQAAKEVAMREPDQKIVQRAVPLHRQFGPLDHGRGDHEPRRAGKISRLFGRKPAQGRRPSPRARLCCES